MAIIIGDIHGDLAMVEAFLGYKPDAEHIALGDFIDSRNPEANLWDELRCLDRLLKSALDSNTVLLWGNHDLAYTCEQPWKLRLYSHEIFETRYASAREKGLLRAAYAVDGWLCTHAGVSTALTRALPDCPWACGDAAVVADWINSEFDREIATPRKRRGLDPEGPFGEGPLFYIGPMRGGHDPFGGIFWRDERWERGNPPDQRLKQIFGHTKVKSPSRRGNHVNIHIEEDNVFWVFDTEVDDFVRLPPKCDLVELVSRITPENKHDCADTDFGAPVGRELL